ncbi:G-protein coupled receptor moody [Acyrthosiphon pisum]|uniref:G-protein coupled receptors family 1 profile domain-containing protein n=1 Tax=Acyrthosiphon pisum TaxID=7029 RepID=A0A8R2JU71_ACYPI|nr:G-protein coupled receptor moody [Acyrthosiphon pisum]XP_029347428.1 G-protein coupled receptor moody [Acyrthosiphon pisum]|eukprot:XP_008178143.1 PREDICTED: G-protein coupled receptor moody isoform X1 [Acyrthosiphon pisum]
MIRDWAMHWFYTKNGLIDKNRSVLDVYRQENVSEVANIHDWQNELETELFQGYSPALLTFASICCVVYMMVGVPGNLITIIALFRCKKVRNATAVFIINLSVSDLSFCCFNLPLAASTFWYRSWIHGQLLCRLFPLVRYGLLAVSLFTILAITINRYIMIGHPSLYPKLYKKFYLGVMVTVTWVGGFGLLIPTWLGKWGQFGLDVTVGSCSILPDSVGRSPKEILFMGAFVVPCLSIVVCYARIFYIVRKTALKSRATVTTNSRHTMNTKPSDATPYYTLKTRFKVPEISTDSAIGSSTATGTCSTTDSKEQNFLSPHDIIADPSSSGLDESYSPISFSDRRSSRRRDRSPSSALNATITQVVSAVFQTKEDSSPRTRKQSTIGVDRMSSKDKKLLKMILVIFASFVTCYLPITISKTSHELDDLHVLNITAYVLIYLTTCINPIIYVVMSSEYRQAYKNLLMCKSSLEQQQTHRGVTKKLSGP